jgi:hypothetical protein
MKFEGGRCDGEFRIVNRTKVEGGIAMDQRLYGPRQTIWQLKNAHGRMLIPKVDCIDRSFLRNGEIADRLEEVSNISW